MMEEMDNPKLKEQRRKLDEPDIAKRGEPVTETEFPDKDLTRTYDAYVNDMTEGTPNLPDKYLKPNTEAGNNDVNADVFLPCGGTLSR